MMYDVNHKKLLSLKEAVNKQDNERETSDSENWNISKENINLYTGDGLYEKDFQDNELQYNDPHLDPLPFQKELRPFEMMRRI